MQSIERDEYKKQAKSSDDDDDDDVRAVMKRGIWKKGSTDKKYRVQTKRQRTIREEHQQHELVIHSLAVLFRSREE